MYIAMLGWEFPPYKAGGLGVHCYELTKELPQLDVKIDLYIPKMDKIESEVKNLRIIEIGENITPYVTGKIKGDFFTALKRYNELCIEKVRGNYDLIHSHDWLTVPAAIHLKNKLSIPWVLTMHSTEYDRCGFINPWQWILDIEKNGMENANRIITVSHITSKILVNNYCIPENKINVIYNGITPIGVGEKKQKIVLFLGRLTIQKGPEFFLQAIKKVLEYEDCRVIVAGGGDMLPQLIDLAIKLGIGDKVMFTGMLSDEEVRYLYKISSVYVLSSVSEPFGITVLEAISAGTPVIVSKTAGVSEIVKNCLVVDFWDVDELANKIIALLRYIPLAKVMAQKSLDEIKYFTWYRTAEETVKVYKELLH